MCRYQDSKLTPLGATETLKCQPLQIANLPLADQVALHAFNEKVAAAVTGNFGRRCPSRQPERHAALSSRRRP